jgi:membrane protease YdiL (CAAX protease family)
MNTQSNPLTARDWIERIVLAVLFVGIGMLIYLVFSPMRPLIDDRNIDYLGRIGLVAILAISVWLVGKSQRYKPYRPVFLGLAIMAATITIDRIFGVYLITYLNVTDANAAGWAVQKVNECIIVAGVVIALTCLSGGSLGSIYLHKGNLKLGLLIGLVTFGLAAAGSTVMASFLFKGQDMTWERISAWLPWLLIFVLANAAQEEILFRGLFLRKLQPFFGKFLSNLLVMLVFTALHQGVDYTSDNLIFLAATSLVALAWGYIMQKTDSAWGSILFHAGMDIPIMLGIFSNL